MLMSYLCVICNKEIIPKNKNKLKHHSYMKNLKYCSHFCSSYARRIGSNNIIYLNCAMCNKLVTIPKSRAKKLKQKGFNDRPLAYCSANCHNLYMKYCQRHDKQVKRHKDYGPNWQYVRDEIRKKYEYKCADCGISELNYGKQLSVHHIIPFVSFDSYKEANELSNLVALCEGCHRKRHSGQNHHSNFSVFGKNAINMKNEQYFIRKQIFHYLLLGTYTYDEISNLTGESIKRIKAMNLGYKINNFTRNLSFPISNYANFHYKYSNRPIDIDLLPKILNELLFTTKTCKQIATELGIKPHTVAAISRGELFSELHNYNLPIR